MRRRTFLHGALLAAAGSAMPASAADTAPAIFVLVHGAWHGAQHWTRVAVALAGHGHQALALDLPAHGLNAQYPDGYFGGDRGVLRTAPSPVAGLTLDDAADAVISALRTLRARRRRLVLVGHSMAGNVITRVAERAPALVDRLVYLAAFMPVQRASPADYAVLPEARTEHGQSVFIGDPVQLGVARIDPRSPDPAYQARLHAGYYGDVDQATFRACANSLTPDLPLGFYTGAPRPTRGRWGRIARTYLRTAHDGAIPPALQDLFIREADAWVPGNRTRVQTLATSHSPFASQPEALAAALARQIA